MFPCEFCRLFGTRGEISSSPFDPCRSRDGGTSGKGRAAASKVLGAAAAAKRRAGAGEGGTGEHVGQGPESARCTGARPMAYLQTGEGLGRVLECRRRAQDPRPPLGQGLKKGSTGSPGGELWWQGGGCRRHALTELLLCQATLDHVPTWGARGARPERRQEVGSTSGARPGGVLTGGRAAAALVAGRQDFTFLETPWESAQTFFAYVSEARDFISAVISTCIFWGSLGRWEWLGTTKLLTF